MKEYQKAKREVKGSIKILNEESIMDTATRGLKNLCTVMGMEIMRQLLEMDVIQVAGEKGRHNALREAYTGTDTSRQRWCSTVASRACRSRE